MITAYSEVSSVQCIRYIGKLSFRRSKYLGTSLDSLIEKNSELPVDTCRNKELLLYYHFGMILSEIAKCSAFTVARSVLFILTTF